MYVPVLNNGAMKMKSKMKPKTMMSKAKHSLVNPAHITSKNNIGMMNMGMKKKTRM